MTNLRNEIADVVNDFSVNGFVEDEHALADAILAKIKDSVPPQTEYTRADLVAPATLPISDAKDKRIEELEANQSKDWANINVKANFIDKCLNDIAVKDELIFKLTKALGTIKGWDVGPSGSTTAERSMRRIAEQALTAQTRN